MEATISRSRGDPAAHEGTASLLLAPPRDRWTRVPISPTLQREENSRAGLLDDRTRVIGRGDQEGPEAIARYNVLVQLSGAVLAQARPIRRGMFGRLC